MSISRQHLRRTVASIYDLGTVRRRWVVRWCSVGTYLTILSCRRVLWEVQRLDRFLVGASETFQDSIATDLTISVVLATQFRPTLDCWKVHRCGLDGDLPTRFQ